MRHNVAGRKLRRTTSHRKALLKNLAVSLIIHERIETTVAKAKELRRIVERMITLGKKGDLSSRRRAFSVLRHEPSVAKLFTTFADRYKARNGGYTRIIKFRKRKGDGADLSFIELVDRAIKEKKKKKPEAKEEKKA
ncbi:MAG: 50S ribosomal protein L17 [Deltaproteobacteria bacterium]|nr:50S ribosomal protein L17 [Deltaproteobacteria bacterium]MCL5276915.1 50S ribosomal protein L17 [Deltaproteobacteria bacterium]